MSLKSLTHSVAFKEYLESRRNIIYLLKVDLTESEQLLSDKKRRLANALYYSCVVLLASYLERYIETLVVEAIDVINGSNLILRNIPEQLRVAQIKESLLELALTLRKDMTKEYVGNMLTTSRRISSTFEWFHREEDIFNQLSGEPLIGENRFSNPSPDRIESLFRCFGISSVVGHAIGLEHKPDRAMLRNKTQEMIEKRHNIAHTGGTVTVTKQDIADYMIYSRRLSRGIDTIVRNEILIIGGIWP
jgi:hypothetical protein